MKHTLLLTASVLASLAVLGDATAQKAKDTLRFPTPGSESSLDWYLALGGNISIWRPSVYDNVIAYDPRKASFSSHIAKSWSQPDSMTYEFELRTDVKFHDGHSLDADDVVYTVNYITDPKVNLRFKANWSWIKSIEKLGPHKVRLIANRAIPDGLMWMASDTPIYPEHIHGPLANKLDFGTRPVGTGPLKMLKLDKNTGIVAERHEDYVPSSQKLRAPIGRVIAEPIPEMGTLVAALMTGQADIARDVPADQAKALEESGRFEVSLGPPIVGYNFLGMPSLGIKNVKALGDVRVRTAIVKAIDRKALIDIAFGNLAAGVTPPEGLCNKDQLGCGFTKPVPDYDPAGARKLLAEAGYADGFDVVLSTFPVNSIQATAIAGMLRAVGIRASVSQHQIAQRVQLLSQGKVDMGFYAWNGGGSFDVSGQVARHFLSKEYDDPLLAKMAEETFIILNDAERRRAVAKLMDYTTDNAYAFPIAPLSSTFTHTKEIRLTAKDLHAGAVNPHEFAWK